MTIVDDVWERLTERHIERGPFRNCRTVGNVGVVDFYIDIDAANPPDDGLRSLLQLAVDHIGPVFVTADDADGYRFFNLHFPINSSYGGIISVARWLRKSAAAVEQWLRDEGFTEYLKA